jgi:hypothetical protein
MAIRKYRYDVLPSQLEQAPKPIREDRASPRLLTRITFARSLTRIGQFRVLAERPEGGEALVCLGSTREEALEAARVLIAELPTDVRRLRLEEWQGGTFAGRWQRHPCRESELPPLPWRRPRRRKGRNSRRLPV